MRKWPLILLLSLACPVFGGSDPNDIAGYQISNIAPDSPWHRLGLQNGDIILSVNGKPMKTKKDAEQLAEDLKTGKKFSLKIRRAGKEEIVHFRAK